MRGVEVLQPRAVPWGGPRAMTVRRTLPQRARSLIGAWCFADHYGPDDVSLTGGMRVAGHLHTGLQTVSWLFRGEIEHRDTTGAHAWVRPGRRKARRIPKPTKWEDLGQVVDFDLALGRIGIKVDPRLTLGDC